MTQPIDKKMKYRPILKYYGGKSRISGWVVSHFAAHNIYTEVFGGAGSCLLRKERCYCEVYNDLNEELVNLFRQVRDNGPELLRKISLTPFARAEHDDAYEYTADPLERARRTIIKGQFSRGSDSIYRKSGFRSQNNKAGSLPVHDFATYPSTLQRIVERMRGVIIERLNYLHPHQSRCARCLAAEETTRQWDQQLDLFYSRAEAEAQL